MKKLFITLALALGLVMTVQAQERGLFNQGSSKGSYDNYSTDNRDGEAPMFGLPGSHGSTEDAQTPLGTGTALLLGLGAAYLVTKKNRKK